MSANTPNPFQPPRAGVSDVMSGNVQPQEPTVWSAKGRIGRLRYLAYLMGGYLALLVLVGLGTVLAGMGSPAMMGVLMVVAFVPYMVLNVFCGIQRSHDIGWSGWAVLGSFVPFVNIFIVLMWLFKGGDKGANQYGPPPTDNPLSVKLLGLSMPVLMVLFGMIAAVAIPQYQEYVKRAQEVQLEQQQMTEDGEMSAEGEQAGNPEGEGEMEAGAERELIGDGEGEAPAAGGEEPTQQQEPAERP